MTRDVDRARRGPASLVLCAAVLACGPGNEHTNEGPDVAVALSVSARTSTAASDRSTTPPSKWVVERSPWPTELDDDTGPAACDLARSYRGTIGRTRVTVLLRRSPKDQTVLEGYSHYNREGPAIALAGKLAADGKLEIAEKPGGTFSGACDDMGVLRGKFTVGKKTETFELMPRPAGWPAMYEVRQSAVSPPNHPACAKAAKANEVVQPAIDAEGNEVVTCLPTNPAKRQELLRVEPRLGCVAESYEYRVFGLADAGIEKKVNQILTRAPTKDKLASFQPCPGFRGSHETTSLVVATPDLLVVSGFISEDFGGAHPMNAVAPATAIDLKRGERVTLEDIVDPVRLRDVAAKCLPIHRLAMGGDTFELGPTSPDTCETETSPRFFWGCGPDDRKDPHWALLPEGIVIGGWANPHASAALDGSGPILPWSILLREGVLRVGSPVSRLWSGVAPAPADALPCTSSIELDQRVTWRRQVPL